MQPGPTCNLTNQDCLHICILQTFNLETKRTNTKFLCKFTYDPSSGHLQHHPTPLIDGNCRRYDVPWRHTRPAVTSLFTMSSLAHARRDHAAFGVWCAARPSSARALLDGTVLNLWNQREREIAWETDDTSTQKPARNTFLSEIDPRRINNFSFHFHTGQSIIHPFATSTHPLASSQFGKLLPNKGSQRRLFRLPRLLSVGLFYQQRLMMHQGEPRLPCRGAMRF